MTFSELIRRAIGRLVGSTCARACSVLSLQVCIGQMTMRSRWTRTVTGRADVLDGHPVVVAVHWYIRGWGVPVDLGRTTHRP